ncbi:MAG: bifunctional enzyme IspD/IspF [Gemmatimonadota bacterium]|nr:MAG: bifunctional enzyme IspD/IspF [Gemmatimonadota bacterium]
MTAETAPRVGAVIVAAGSSSRMSGLDKVLAPLAGTPLVLHSVRVFQDSPHVHEIVIVTRPELEPRLHELAERHGLTKVKRVVRGGRTRAESSRHGVSALSQDVELVLVHDGARPLVTGEVVTRVVEAATLDGAAIPGVPPVPTIKREANGASAGTLDRAELREAQTPQGFHRSLLARAFAAVMKEGLEPSDEAAMVEHLGERVTIVAGERRNLKVTVPEDLVVAEALLAGRTPPQQTRVGIGYDVHRLEEGRPLILGGVTIAHAKGLLGHSDADVLSHAIVDALFGAAGVGDLGHHFPDTDAEWEGASGERLLVAAVEILRDSGYVPTNVDATVSAQAPQLAPHRAAMIAHLARALLLPEQRVSVKFTTTERLGFEGREEGISATAVVQIGSLPMVAEIE